MDISKFDVPDEAGEETKMNGGLIESDFAGTESLDKNCNLLVVLFIHQ